MRAFASSWPNRTFVQQAAAQIPWVHNCTLLDKISHRTEREWYLRQTIENGWSRNILVHQIESRLYHRRGKALTNFTRTLPSPQSELAQQVLKDPYNFDFLAISESADGRPKTGAEPIRISNFQFRNLPVVRRRFALCALLSSLNTKHSTLFRYSALSTRNSVLLRGRHSSGDKDKEP